MIRPNTKKKISEALSISKVYCSFFVLPHHDANTSNIIPHKVNNSKFIVIFLFRSKIYNMELNK